MKLNIKELMRNAENDARDYYRARLNQPCGGATFEGDYLPERNRAFARLIVERCAAIVQENADVCEQDSMARIILNSNAAAIRKLLEAE